MGDRNPGCELGENVNGILYIVFHFKNRKFLGYGRNYFKCCMYIYLHSHNSSYEDVFVGQVYSLLLKLWE
jgi:hypothetical protein